jgi:hypothetical protein
LKKVGGQQSDVPSEIMQILLILPSLMFLQTVRGQREHARKCSGAHRNHQQQA